LAGKSGDLFRVVLRAQLLPRCRLIITDLANFREARFWIFRVADKPQTGLVAHNLLPALKAFRIPDDRHASQAVLTVPIQCAATNL